MSRVTFEYAGADRLQVRFPVPWWRAVLQDVAAFGAVWIAVYHVAPEFGLKTGRAEPMTLAVALTVILALELLLARREERLLVTPSTMIVMSDVAWEIDRATAPDVRVVHQRTRIWAAVRRLVIGPDGSDVSFGEGLTHAEGAEVVEALRQIRAGSGHTVPEARYTAFLATGIAVVAPMLALVGMDLLPGTPVVPEAFFDGIRWVLPFAVMLIGRRWPRRHKATFEC